MDTKFYLENLTGAMVDKDGFEIDPKEYMLSTHLNVDDDRNIK